MIENFTQTVRCKNFVHLRVDYVCVDLISVSDPHRFYADPDPAFLLNADPDPDPTCRI
jgi:hypothetical protein